VDACDWERLAEEWAAGTLDPTTARRYARHAATCPVCRAAVQQTARVADLMVFTNSRERAPRRPWRLLREGRPARRPVWWWAAAAGVAAVGLWSVSRGPAGGAAAQALPMQTPAGVTDGRALLAADRLTVSLRGLAPLPRADVYEAWVYGPHTDRAIGALAVTGAVGRLTTAVDGADVRRVVVCEAPRALAAWTPGRVVSGAWVAGG
jgi:hypothetical protein